MKTAQVLSLAGGGTWALVEARALMDLYPDLTGHQILNQFDIAIANSGGALVLAGLAADLSPKQIYTYFSEQQYLQQLYIETEGLNELGSHLGIAPRWSSAGKLLAIRKVLGGVSDYALTHVKTKIAFCAYDLDRSLETIFRSYSTPLALESCVFVPTLADAAHASSAAPVLYFDKPAIVINQNNPHDVRRFWDGALGSYNLPLRAGLAEAHALGFTKVNILSLACGTIWRPMGGSSSLYTPTRSTGLLGTIVCLAKACLTAGSITALHTTCVCPGVAMVHLSPDIRPDGEPGTWKIPAGLVGALGADAWDRLINLDFDVHRSADVDLLCRMTQAWIAGGISNEPIVRDPLTGKALQGAVDFASSVAQWRSLVHQIVG